MQEVSGSIPLTSTTVVKTLSPSSRGLGHRPFTAITGVRIPVGTPEMKKATQRGWLFSFLLSACVMRTRRGFDNDEAFGTSLVLDAGPFRGRRSEAPGFGASDESREDQ